MENGGNKKVNWIFEASRGLRKPNPSAGRVTRENFIRDKYVTRKFYSPKACIDLWNKKEESSDEDSFADVVGRKKNEPGDSFNNSITFDPFNDSESFDPNWQAFPVDGNDSNSGSNLLSTSTNSLLPPPRDAPQSTRSRRPVRAEKPKVEEKKTEIRSQTIRRGLHEIPRDHVRARSSSRGRKPRRMMKGRSKRMDSSLSNENDFDFNRSISSMDSSGSADAGKEKLLMKLQDCLSSEDMGTEEKLRELVSTLEQEVSGEGVERAPRRMMRRNSKNRSTSSDARRCRRQGSESSLSLRGKSREPARRSRSKDPTGLRSSSRSRVRERRAARSRDENDDCSSGSNEIED